MALKKKPLGSRSPPPPFQTSTLWLQTLQDSRAGSGVLTHISVLLARLSKPTLAAQPCRRTATLLLTGKRGHITAGCFSRSKRNQDPVPLCFQIPEGETIHCKEAAQCSRVVRSTTTLWARNVWIHISVPPLTRAGSLGKLLNYS